MTDELERRRKDDRRVDPDAWSPAHRRNVKFIYGLVVGGLLIFAGVIVVIWGVTNDEVGNRVVLLGGGLVLLGLVASMPSTFMPVFSAILKKIPWGRAAEENGSITRALPRIETDEDGE